MRNSLSLKVLTPSISPGSPNTPSPVVFLARSNNRNKKIERAIKHGRNKATRCLTSGEIFSNKSAKEWERHRGQIQSPIRRHRAWATRQTIEIGERLFRKAVMDAADDDAKKIKN